MTFVQAVCMEAKGCHTFVGVCHHDLRNVWWLEAATDAPLFNALLQQMHQ